MAHGYRRRTSQILPVSGARVVCVTINDEGLAEVDWWQRSFESWPHHHRTSLHYRDWDYVLVVPLHSVRNYWCSNDGMQAWRYKVDGYVIPDHCRQTGGCPEIWNTSDVKGKKEREISNLWEIEEFVILQHQTPHSPWPELGCTKARHPSYQR